VLYQLSYASGGLSNKPAACYLPKAVGCQLHYIKRPQSREPS
jgi:hypothetical protein